MNRRIKRDVKRLQRRNAGNRFHDTKWGFIPPDAFDLKLEFFRTPNGTTISPTNGFEPGAADCDRASFDGTEFATLADDQVEVFSMFTIPPETFFVATTIGTYRFAVRAMLKAAWIEFHLDEALATTDASCDATVDAYHDGRNPDPSSSGITLYNKSANSNYIFEGSTNDKGEAWYSPENDYYIISQLQCD